MRGRKIDGPLRQGQPERLPCGAFSQVGDARGIEYPPLAVECVDPDQPFDLSRYHGEALLGRLRPPHHFARRLADERRPIDGAPTAHDEIRLGERRVKADTIQHPLRAWAQTRLRAERETPPQTARPPP